MTTFKHKLNTHLDLLNSKDLSQYSKSRKVDFEKAGVFSNGSTRRTGSAMRKPQVTEELILLHPMKDGAQAYLGKIGELVNQHSQTQIKLKRVEKYTFRLGSFKDTSFKTNPDLLEEWEQFYLPEEMKMVVIGVLENFPCRTDSAELVLMVCEDGNVFAYEDDRLHLVASSLEEMFESGVQFPGSKSYYRGQSFEDMTDEDWDEVNKSKEVVEKNKEHQDMLKSLKPTYLANLEIIKQRLQTEIWIG